MRLCSDHYELLISFAEKHPQIVTNAFVGLSGQANAKALWEQLATELNALGYGTLSINDYKRRLTDWKSKTKAKAAEMNKSLVKTGGGPATPITLSSLERRLIALMGNKCYKGDEKVKEMGFTSSESKSSATDSNRTIKRMKRFEVVSQDPSSSTAQAFLVEDNGTSFIETEALLEAPADSERDNQGENEHDYTFIPVESPKTSNVNPSSTSTERRRKITDLSENIKKINDQTLSVLCQIDNNLSELNRNVNTLTDTINIGLISIANNVSKLTDVVISLCNKFT